LCNTNKVLEHYLLAVAGSFHRQYETLLEISFDTTTNPGVCTLMNFARTQENISVKIMATEAEELS
jgi:hypothetical protein